MKNLVIFSFLFVISIPSFAACLIDDIEKGEAVCTLNQTTNQISPLFQNPQAGSTLKDTKPQLNPLSDNNRTELMRGPNANLNYSSGCQFGQCLQNPNNKLQNEQQ